MEEETRPSTADQRTEKIHFCLCLMQRRLHDPLYHEKREMPLGNPKEKAEHDRRDAFANRKILDRIVSVDRSIGGRRRDMTAGRPQGRSCRSAVVRVCVMSPTSVGLRVSSIVGAAKIKEKCLL